LAQGGVRGDNDGELAPAAHVFRDAPYESGNLAVIKRDFALAVPEPSWVVGICGHFTLETGFEARPLRFASIF
jgi:hypothetical protein